MGRQVGVPKDTYYIPFRCGESTKKHLLYLEKYTGKSRSQIIRDAIEFYAMDLQAQITGQFGSHEDPIYDDFGDDMDGYDRVGHF